LLHGYHHICPMDRMRLTFPPAPAAVLAGLIYLCTLRPLFGPVHAPGLLGGMVLGYIVYDCTHYWLHHADPDRLLGAHQRLKTHHLYHHYKNPQRNFGISSSLADWAFGTYDEQLFRKTVAAKSA